MFLGDSKTHLFCRESIAILYSRTRLVRPCTLAAGTTIRRTIPGNFTYYFDLPDSLQQVIIGLIKAATPDKPPDLPQGRSVLASYPVLLHLSGFLHPFPTQTPALRPAYCLPCFVICLQL
ncbi:hypothetical protein AAHC03_09991 [Spirometra sp. Aus1]